MIALADDDRPNDVTLFRWLYQTMKRVPFLKDMIQKIKDSRKGSDKKSFSWMRTNIKRILKEKKHDMNLDSLANMYSQPPPKQVHAMASAVEVQTPPTHVTVNLQTGGTPIGNATAPQTGGEDTAPALPAQTKGGGRGKTRSKSKGPRKKVSEMTAEEKKKIKCIFHRRGTCSSGAGCEFSHDCAQDLVRPDRAGITSGAAAAALSGMIGASQLTEGRGENTQGQDSSEALNERSDLEFWKGYGIRHVIPILASAFSQISTMAAELAPDVTEISAMSAAVQEQFQRTESLAVELLGDTGAGETIGSLEALRKQGVPDELLEKLTQVLERPMKFSTGGGAFSSLRTN